MDPAQVKKLSTRYRGQEPAGFSIPTITRLLEQFLRPGNPILALPAGVQDCELRARLEEAFPAEGVECAHAARLVPGDAFPACLEPGEAGAARFVAFVAALLVGRRGPGTSAGVPF